MKTFSMEPLLPTDSIEGLSDLPLELGRSGWLLESRGAPVRLGFPLDVVERWFPGLYPVV